MKPQWGVALISFTLKIFFIFWSSGRNCIDHQFTLKTGTKILPPIPAIEGSVKQDLSLFVQISILYFFWFLFYISFDFFFRFVNNYILFIILCLFQISAHILVLIFEFFFHIFLCIVKIQCWSMSTSSWLFVEISIWTFGEKAPLRTTGQHMFKSICLYFYLYSYMYFYLKFYLCFYLKRPLIGQLCDTCSNAVVCISPRTLSSYCHCIDFSM